MKAYRSRKGPFILKLDDRWRRMVNFTLRPPCHRKIIPVPFDLKSVLVSAVARSFIHFRFLIFLYIYYRVIHKSEKHFKNSQQIDYSTDHGISYADKERNSPSFFIYIHIFHRCSMYPPLVIRQKSLR